MRQALGKGIGALIPSAPARSREPVAAVQAAAEAAHTADGIVREIPLDAIAANPRQPRDQFEESALAELARSIATHGVLQPILVRALDDHRYELIAGERRLRAARQANLPTIPAMVREANDDESLVLAIVENIQRAELSPLEEARAFRALIDDFSLTQEEAAQRVGKSRPAVANALRLLALPEDVQAELAAGRITAGHARALLGLESDAAKVTLAREIVQRKLSVRDTESAVTRSSTGKPGAATGDPDVRRLEEDLMRALGTKVAIHAGKSGAGRIEISFYSDDELARLADALIAAGRVAPMRMTRL
jgi:ParB family transcriptional regulator, chromosome partitioning protein